MRLPGEFIRDIVEHARQGKPNEVCGLIAAQDGQPVRLYRMTNSDPNPRVRYNVDPSELLQVLSEIEQKGWKLLSIFHSHPETDAYPSRTDISLAYYPEAVYIIVSLANVDAPIVRAFQIIEGRVTELPLEVDGDPALLSGVGVRLAGPSE